MSQRIQWGEPPERPARKGRAEVLRPFIEALADRQGEWARYPRTLKSTSSGYTTAKNLRARGHGMGYEVSTEVRKVGGKYGVWACVTYVHYSVVYANTTD